MVFRVTIHFSKSLPVVLNSFSSVFSTGLERLIKMTSGEVIAIDGKSLRHSYDKKSRAECYSYGECLGDENRLALGQVKVNNKSNEITRNSP